MLLLERTILRQLFASPQFTERVVPYLKDEYFTTQEGSTIYRAVQEFHEKYHQLPSFSAIRLELDRLPELNERDATNCREALKEVESQPPMDDTQKVFILEQTEKYCQERALYVALRQSVAMLDDPKSSPHAIPELLSNALSISFDMHVGHDFFGDAEARFEFYHRAEERLPFDIEILNTITKNGVPKKTLNVVLAGTNVGKSHFLCHQTAAYLRMNKNVLYITLEMAEERIAERIDANMMDIPIDDLVALTRSQFMRKVDTLRKTSTGRLIIKEYPTGAAHSGHFRALLQELKAKQNFVPDVIVVDYLSICSSARIKNTVGVNSYSYNKAIAEELRSLGQEFGIPVWTAAQFNRDGSGATDPGLDKISESFAIAMTADFIIALVTSEELEKNGQLQGYTLKNRYGKRNSFQKFLLGSDTSRMKLWEAQPSGGATYVIPPPIEIDDGSASSTPFNFRPTGRRRPLAHLKTGDEE